MGRISSSTWQLLELPFTTRSKCKVILQGRPTLAILTSSGPHPPTDLQAKLRSNFRRSGFIIQDATASLRNQQLP